MIRGMHGMFYASEPEKLRAFFRDQLGFTGFDVGDGWLIFDMKEADLGCHPADASEGGANGAPSISFYCDDIQKTVAELKGRGVKFTGEPEDHGYGFVTHMKAPGGFDIQLYQPKYTKGPKAASKAKPKAKAKAKKAPARKPSGKERKR